MADEKKKNGGIIIVVVIVAALFMFPGLLSGLTGSGEDDDGAGGGAGGSAGGAGKAAAYADITWAPAPEVQSILLTDAHLASGVILLNTEFDSARKTADARATGLMPKYTAREIAPDPPPATFRWVALSGSATGATYNPRPIDLGLPRVGTSALSSGRFASIYVPSGYVVRLYMSRAPNATVTAGFRTLTLPEGKFSTLKFEQTLGAIVVFNRGGLTAAHEGRPSCTAYVREGYDVTEIQAVPMPYENLVVAPLAQLAAVPENAKLHMPRPADNPLRAPVVPGDTLFPLGKPLGTSDQGQTVTLPTKFLSVKIPAGIFCVAWKAGSLVPISKVTMTKNPFQVLLQDTPSIVWPDKSLGATDLFFGVFPNLEEYGDHKPPADLVVDGNMVARFADVCPPCYYMSAAGGEAISRSLWKCTHQDAAFFRAAKPEWAAKAAWDATVITNEDRDEWIGATDEERAKSTPATRLAKYNEWLKFPLGADANFRKIIGCPLDYNGSAAERYVYAAAPPGTTGGTTTGGTTTGGTGNTGGTPTGGTGDTGGAGTGNETYIPPGGSTAPPPPPVAYDRTGAPYPPALTEAPAGQKITVTIKEKDSPNHKTDRYYGEGNVSWDSMYSGAGGYGCDSPGGGFCMDNYSDPELVITAIPDGYRVRVYPKTDMYKRHFPGMGEVFARTGGAGFRYLTIPSGASIKIDRFRPNEHDTNAAPGSGIYGNYTAATAPTDSYGYKGVGGPAYEGAVHPRLNSLPRGFDYTFTELSAARTTGFVTGNKGCPACYKRVGNKCYHLDSEKVIGAGGYPDYDPLKVADGAVAPKGLPWLHPSDRSYIAEYNKEFGYSTPTAPYDQANVGLNPLEGGRVPWLSMPVHDDPGSHLDFYTASGNYAGCDPGLGTVKSITDGSVRPVDEADYGAAYAAYKGKIGGSTSWQALADGYNHVIPKDPTTGARMHKATECLPCYGEKIGDPTRCVHMHAAQYTAPGREYSKEDLENAVLSAKSKTSTCSGKEYIQCWGDGTLAGNKVDPPYIGCTPDQQIQTAILNARDAKGERETLASYALSQMTPEALQATNYDRQRMEDVAKAARCGPCYKANDASKTCTHVMNPAEWYSYDTAANSGIPAASYSCPRQIAELTVNQNTGGTLLGIPPYGWSKPRQDRYTDVFNQTASHRPCDVCYENAWSDASKCVHTVTGKEMPSGGRMPYGVGPPADGAADTRLEGCSARFARSSYFNNLLWAESYGTNTEVRIKAQCGTEADRGTDGTSCPMTGTSFYTKENADLHVYLFPYWPEHVTVSQGWTTSGSAPPDESGALDYISALFSPMPNPSYAPGGIRIPIGGFVGDFGNANSSVNYIPYGHSDDNTHALTGFNSTQLGYRYIRVPPGAVATVYSDTYYTGTATRIVGPDTRMLVTPPYSIKTEAYKAYDPATRKYTHLSLEPMASDKLLFQFDAYPNLEDVNSGYV